MANTEAWLRQQSQHITAELWPVAAMIIAATEDIVAATTDLRSDEFWMSVGGAATIGFHIFHLANATDRLLTYAEGQALTSEQRDLLVRERALESSPIPSKALLEHFTLVMNAALVRLEGITPQILAEPRTLGRAKLPTTMRGLVFHTGEHAARHAGQVVTTAKIICGLRTQTPA